MFKRKQVFQDSDGESLFLWGARQSGKTSLLKKIYQILLLFSASLLTFSCSDAIVEPKSSEKEIVTFFVDDVEAIIDHSAKTIVLVLPPTSNLTSVKPLLSVSDKASVNPTSGTEKNFTNPVKYTVTAEDGTQQQYTVILTVSKPADKDILGFYISGELSNIWGTINGETNIIHMEVPADMDITKLKPVVVISPTATVSPASGVEQDFSKPVLYIVTAQDGSMREFMVIVEKKRVDKANPRLVITIRMNEYNDRPYRYLEYDNKDRLVHYTETAASRPGQEANMDVVKVVYGVNGQIVKLIKLEDAETARENLRTLNITYPDSKKIHVTEQLTATISKLDVIILNDAGKVSRFVKDGETEVFEYDVAGNLIRLTGIGEYIRL